MSQINKPPAVEQKPSEVSRVMEVFLTNLHLFTPEQRERVLKLLEYTLLPKYFVYDRPPIEEDWFKKNVNKVIVSENHD